MARTIAESLELLESSRSEIRTALTEKKVEAAESLKISEVAEKIRKIDSYSFTFLITASSTYYDGVTFTASHADGETYTGVMQSGECRITVGKTGEYTITNDLNSNSFTMTAVKEDEYSFTTNPSVLINKSTDTLYTVTYSNVKESVTKKITVTQDTESGQEIEKSYYTVNGSANSYTVTFNSLQPGQYYINAFLSLKGKDIKLSSQSVVIAAESKRIKEGRLNIDTSITSVITTDQKAPSSTSTTDLSYDSDNSVVGWTDGTTYYISTQEPGVKIGVVNGSSLFEGKTHVESGGDYGETIIGESKITTIDLSNMDFSKCTSLDKAFYYQLFLNNIIGIEDIDTSQVTTFASMFEHNSSLKNLDIGSWNTENVTTMENMFSSCSGLRSLDLNSWETKNVTSLKGTFSNLIMLESLKIDSWNVEKVKTLEGAFMGCRKVNDLNINSWKIQNITSLRNAFSEFGKYAADPVIFDLSSWNTSHLTDINQAFNSSGITELNLNGWDISQIKTTSNTTSVFGGSDKLKTIHAEDWTTNSAVRSSGYMFSGCTSLVGGISYDSSKKSGAYAKRDGGYFSA